LDDVKKALDKTRSNDPAVRAAIAGARAAYDRVFHEFTANYANDEDSIQRPGKLREDVEGLFRLTGPPLPALVEFARTVDAQYSAVISDYNAFVSSDIAKLNEVLKAAHLPLLRTPDLIASTTTTVAAAKAQTRTR